MNCGFLPQNCELCNCNVNKRQESEFTQLTKYCLSKCDLPFAVLPDSERISSGLGFTAKAPHIPFDY